jgi:tetratricopeptide (TPR) repeat protein
VSGLPTTAADLFFKELDELRRAAGEPSPKRISEATAIFHSRAVPENTLKVWFKHLHLPRKELSEPDFLAVITALYYMRDRDAALVTTPRGRALPQAESDYWLNRLHAAHRQNTDQRPTPEAGASTEEAAATAPAVRQVRHVPVSPSWVRLEPGDRSTHDGAFAGHSPDVGTAPRSEQPAGQMVTAIIKWLAQKTGKDDLVSQAKVLGIGKSTLGRYLEGDLPTEKMWQRVLGVAVVRGWMTSEQSVEYLDHLNKARKGWTVTPTGLRQLPPPVPSREPIAHLPPDSGTFTGRGQEVSHLVQLLTCGWTATSVPTVVIAGMAGVGKTRLAVHVAHLLRTRYDEIQFYMDLRGYGPDRPVEPTSALEVLLRHLGVPPEDIPPDQDARTALFRDRLHGRRAILLLDNAVSETQVRALLPASPSCCVVVTSRRQLESLDEARLMHLDVMHLDDAVGLLAQLIGADRLAAEAGHAREIAVQCGGLPLALTLVGCRLRARPSWRLGRMSERLRETDRRLTEMGGRDRAVRAAFELSYAQLTEANRVTFGLLACHPGRDFSARSAAALTGVDHRTIEQVLEDLLDENLLEQETEGRYRFHDLLRLFAQERLQAEQPDGVIAEAQRRVLGWYLRAATQADHLLVPHRLRNADRDSTMMFDSHEQALSWCDTERAALASAVRMAAAMREHATAWQLAHVLFGYHRLRHSWQEWLCQLRIGLAAAREVADEEAEARILNCMGAAHSNVDQHGQAHDCFSQALLIHQRRGDRGGQSSTLNNLGELYRLTGRYDRAIVCYEQDRVICQELADVYGQSICLNNLGKAQLAIGQAAEALASQREALHLCGNHHDRHAKAEIFDDLGNVYRRLGQHADALRHYGLAVETYRGIGCNVAAASTLVTIVEVLIELDRSAEAQSHAVQALSIIDNPATASAGPLPQRLRLRLTELVR